MTRKNTRRSNGILSSDSDPSLDADVIMTAAVVGFSKVLLEDSRPVQFDSEGIHARMTEQQRVAAQRSYEDMQVVVKRINFILDYVGTKGRVTAGYSPGYDVRSKLIFGVEDGSSVAFEDRSAANQLSEIASELQQEVVNTDVGYRGRGAYTGFVVPPEGSHSNPMVTSTFRMIVPDDDEFGERWHPTETVGPIAIGPAPNQKTWGMILTNKLQESPNPGDNTLKKSGMGFAPADQAPVPGEDIIGYTHGMTQAVVACQHRGEAGSRPFEIAVGNETTKLASCFPCTVFMYACGYPPSSIHLDSGESWVPFYEFAPDVDEAIRATSALWYDFCRLCLTSGVYALNDASNDHLQKSHHDSLIALSEFLSERLTDEAPKMVAANLILDALTVHSKERERIKRTIMPF